MRWMSKFVYMEREEIIALLNRVICPVYQIEVDLGMPKTTLQKAIKGERKLPKKWAVKLLEIYGPKTPIKPKESSKSENNENTSKQNQETIIKPDNDDSPPDWKRQLEIRRNQQKNK